MLINPTLLMNKEATLVKLLATPDDQEITAFQYGGGPKVSVGQAHIADETMHGVLFFWLSMF